MTPTNGPSSPAGDAIGAFVAPVIGYLTFVLAMFSGEYFGINMDSDRAGNHDHTAIEVFTESLGEFGLGLVGLAITIVVTARVWKRQPEQLARTSLVLGILGALTVIAFWSGWPLIFGAAAVGLAVEARRRLGSLGAPGWIGLVIGAVAFVAAAVTCLTG